MFGTSDGAAAEGTDIAYRLLSYAGWLRTSAAAMAVTLPGQFSTITCQPSDSVSSFETMRLTIAADDVRLLS